MIIQTKRMMAMAMTIFTLQINSVVCQEGMNLKNIELEYGGIVRGDKSKKELALVFTGGDYGEGGNTILSTLSKYQIKASFFFTGDFYSNTVNQQLIQNLISEQHYLGAHSDKHILYCDWYERDSLLVTKDEFTDDLLENFLKMQQFGIKQDAARFFIPPYEWYNDSISSWSKDIGLYLVNYTKGTLSNADYTTPDLRNYRNSQEIYQSILDFEENSEYGLNGYILLMHIGTHPDRTDKFYNKLDVLIEELQKKGYSFMRIDHLLST
ncbi:polysaccharide deacetylase family protein [Portibacter marinus]|uniref:polysaccharide deacetylase family protein n=1 Tax=Portibacter marinus TaxID=2898660 RepID=UPI001F3A311B|nr:polysaccharide deacetylase family protein [Portibacter marinus]